MASTNDALYSHIINEYQQGLANTQLALATANALGAQKDQHIAELTRQLEAARKSPDVPDAPKPGPPPAK